MFSIDSAIACLRDNTPYITPEHLRQLEHVFLTAKATIPGQIETPALSAEGFTNTDLLEEVEAQFKIIRQLRELVTEGDKVDARGLKDLISSSTALFGMLNKLRDNVLTQERSRKIEFATIEAVKTLPIAVQDKFFTDLEGILEKNNV